jgi:hypothetical protein
MFFSEPETTTLGQLTFAEVDCPTCELFHACGGSATAPCRCVYETSDPAYRACSRCNVICREHDAGRDHRGRRNNFETQYRSGLALSQVQLAGRSDLPYPIFIPTRTQELPAHLRIPVAVAGLDLRSLNVAGSLWGRNLGATASNLRDSLRVLPDTTIYCILNGRDALLERFWSKNRNFFYDQARRWDIAAITGPTFSIYGEGTGLPSSHNVLALSRHHRCLQEFSDAGLTPIPNLYWRNPSDIRGWIQFLSSHSKLNVVSRDFSCTKGLDEFRTHLDGLICILAEAGRSFHVVMVGVGTSKAAIVIDQLAAIGCTCSFVTADPVMTARSGGKRFIDEDTRLVTRVEHHIPHSELILHNLVVAERFLSRLAGRHPIYTQLSNGLLSLIDTD